MPCYAATHDIIEVMATATQSNDIQIKTVYTEQSDAMGALFSFVFISDIGTVDFTKSILLALDKNSSHDYTLPFNLFAGQYRLFVYDTEIDGTVSNGVGYPAVTDELRITGNSQGI